MVLEWFLVFAVWKEGGNLPSTCYAALYERFEDWMNRHVPREKGIIEVGGEGG